MMALTLGPPRFFSGVLDGDGDADAGVDGTASTDGVGVTVAPTDAEAAGDGGISAGVGDGTKMNFTDATGDGGDDARGCSFALHSSRFNLHHGSLQKQVDVHISQYFLAKGCCRHTHLHAA